MKSWYSIKALADTETEVVIYDEIGYSGVTAKQFISEFKKIPQGNTVFLRINSPGGDPFDGLAIYNVIARHPGAVKATIDGLAASMASVIAMAANEITMPDNTYMMIHNPWGISIGDAEEMIKTADLLGKLANTLADTYAKRSGQEAEKIAELMNDETWLTAAEAKELGLADNVTEALPLAASYSLDRFQKLPAKLREGLNLKSKIENPKSEEALRAKIQAETAEIHKLCASAGVPDYAAELIGKNKTVAQVAELLKDSGSIRDACTAARLPDRASGYIKSGLSLDEIRAELLDIKAKRDALADIDNKEPEKQHEKKVQPVDIDQRAIYAKRNGKK